MTAPHHRGGLRPEEVRRTTSPFPRRHSLLRSTQMAPRTAATLQTLNRYDVAVARLGSPAVPLRHLWASKAGSVRMDEPLPASRRCADGWQRVAQDEETFGDHSRAEMMRSVTAGGPGLVAVGRDDGRKAAAVWTSFDGMQWQRVTHDEAEL